MLQVMFGAEKLEDGTIVPLISVELNDEQTIEFVGNFNVKEESEARRLIQMVFEILTGERGMKNLQFADDESGAKMNTEFEDMKQAWFNEEVAVDATTLKEFDEYVGDYLAVRAEADALEAQLTGKNKIMQKMQEKLIAYLEAQGKTSHVTPMGTMIAVERTTWKAPDGPERERVVEYLKETNQFDAVMAFNANKFHGWYKAEKESNPEFDLPGVQQASMRYIQFRGKK